MSLPVGTQTTKKKLTAEQRRPRVKMLLQTEGWGPSAIAKQINKDTGSNVSRQKVADDIQVLTAENEMWENNLTLVGWMNTVRNMYQNSMIEIAHLETKLSNHIRAEIIMAKDPTILTKAENDFIMRNESALLELKDYLSLKRTIDNARINLSELMERNVLYRKTAQYSKFFNEHQAQELS